MKHEHDLWDALRPLDRHEVQEVMRKAQGQHRVQIDAAMQSFGNPGWPKMQQFPQLMRVLLLVAQELCIRQRLRLP